MTPIPTAAIFFPPLSWYRLWNMLILSKAVTCLSECLLIFMNTFNHARENVIIFAEVSAEVVLLMYFSQNALLQSKREKIIIHQSIKCATIEYGLHFVGYWITHLYIILCKKFLNDTGMHDFTEFVSVCIVILKCKIKTRHWRAACKMAIVVHSCIKSLCCLQSVNW